MTHHTWHIIQHTLEHILYTPSPPLTPTSLPFFSTSHPLLPPLLLPSSHPPLPPCCCRCCCRCCCFRTPSERLVRLETAMNKVLTLAHHVTHPDPEKRRNEELWLTLLYPLYPPPPPSLSDPLMNKSYVPLNPGLTCYLAMNNTPPPPPPFCFAVHSQFWPQWQWS